MYEIQASKAVQNSLVKMLACGTACETALESSKNKKKEQFH